MKKEPKSNKRKNVGLTIALILAVSIITIIAYTEFGENPTVTMYYWKFENGTSGWVDADTIVDLKMKDGSVVKMTAEKAVEYRPNELVSKTINLKTGTTDYSYSKQESMGSIDP